jgi:hypothetical protein
LDSLRSCAGGCGISELGSDQVKVLVTWRGRVGQITIEDRAGATRQRMRGLMKPKKIRPLQSPTVIGFGYYNATLRLSSTASQHQGIRTWV